MNIEKLCNMYIKHGSKKHILDYLADKTKAGKGELKIQVNRLIKSKKFSYSDNRLTVYKAPIKKEITEKIQKESASIKSVMTVILKWIMFLIFVSCVTQSVKYSIDWKIKETSNFWAVLSALSIVIFGVIIPTITKQLELSKNIKPWFRVIGCIVLLYSMVQTIAGQYTGYTTKKDNSAISSNDSLNESLELIEKNRQRIIEDIAVVRESKKAFKDVDDLKMYHTAREKLDKESARLNTELNENYEEIKILKEKISFLNEDTKGVLQDDFYTWISAILGFDPKIVQLVLSLFPAVFVDVIGPLSLYLFLSNREK